MSSFVARGLFAVEGEPLDDSDDLYLLTVAAQTMIDAREKALRAEYSYLLGYYRVVTGEALLERGTDEQTYEELERILNS